MNQTSIRTTTRKSVAEVLDRLQDLLLSDDEKKYDDDNDHESLESLLDTVLDWSGNAYRRQELTDASSRVLVPALLTAQTTQSTDVVLALLQILDRLAAASAAQRDEMHRAGAVTIAADLASTSDLLPVAVGAFKLLGHLALSPLCAATMGSDVLPTTIRRTLQQKGTPIPIMRQVMGILTNLAGHAATQDQMIRAPGFLAALLHAMEQYQQDARIQQAACQVWWNLLATVNPTTTTTFRSKKADDLPAIVRAWHTLQAVNAVLQALETHADQPGVQEAACGALSRVVWTPKEDDDTRAMSVSLILKLSSCALSSDDASVRTAACRAVASLCRDCPPAASQVTTTVGLQRLSSTAQGACQGNADQVRLALAVLDAWSALAVGAKYATCTALVQAHVVEDTVGCMQAYPDQAVVQDAASLVLWAIAQHYGKYVAAVDGCQQALDTAMETHGDQVRYGAKLQGRLQWKQRWGRR